MPRHLGNSDSVVCTFSLARPIPSATQAPRNREGLAICLPGKRRWTQDYASLLSTQHYGTDTRLGIYFQPALGVSLASFKLDLLAYTDFFFRQIHRPPSLRLTWLTEMGKLIAFRRL